jgi:hypothetical protein
MEAACSSEMLQNFYPTTRRYMPEGSAQHGYDKYSIILSLKTPVISVDTQELSSVRFIRNMTCSEETFWIDFRRFLSVSSLTSDFRLNELELRNSTDDSESEGQS